MLSGKIEKMIPKNEEEKAYDKYASVFGKKANVIGLTVPFGYPLGVEEHGGVIAVYEECIKKGVTWEKLLNYKGYPENVDI